MDLPFTEYFYTFLWSITPFLEMRASIPLGLYKFGLHPIEAIIISSFGGILTAAILLKILPPLTHFLEKYIPLFHNILQKIFTKTRSEHSEKMAKVGALSLVLFVAIPLPGSGAWTGVLIAYLFGLPYWRSVCLVGAGVIFSSLIMTAVSLFGKEIWDLVASWL